MIERQEYTGQLVGGPEDGNFVTSSVVVLYHCSVYSTWLGGSRKYPTIQIVKGTYEWDEEQKHFKWKPLP